MSPTSAFLVIGVALAARVTDGQILKDLDDVLTNTTYGTVKGLARVSAAGTVLSFLAIPYAKPPTGSRRFARPEKADPWSGVRDTRQLGTICPQYRASHYQMSEDCLTLNVYTPSTDGQLPVMVWIHGGSFLTGSGTSFNGTELAHKGVVVVTVNYRLDALGFLSTQDEVAPGNFALLDQLLALEWVKQNIGSFGGDPNQVTIFGESAGAGCVSLLLLSPLAAGLFHRAIIESGSSLSPWVVNYPTSRLTPKYIAGQVGAKVNCKLDNSTQFLDCMRNVSTADLLKASWDFRRAINLDVSFAPVVETTFRVIPERPLKMLKCNQFNHVDTIRGYNTDEALFVLGSPSGIDRDEFRRRISRVVSPFNLANKDQILSEFESLYLGNTTDPDVIVRQALTALSDYTFIAPTIIESTWASEAAPEKKCFLYEFEYRMSVSDTPMWIHAVHGDEVPFVFDAFEDPDQWPVDRGHTADDDMISQEIMNIWTNFAKTGSPLNQTTSNISWQPFSQTQQQVLKIDKVTTTIAQSKQTAVDFYQKILSLIDISFNCDIVG
nr:neuroligin-4; X-linked-like [Biomphalaria glabrata]